MSSVFEVDLATGDAGERGATTDRDVLISVENVDFYSITETLYFVGSSVANQVRGGMAGDTINGMDGDDFLDGDAGNDSLLGGNGNDSLSDGLGIDTLDGGAGTDTFFRSLIEDHAPQSLSPVVDLLLQRFSFSGNLTTGFESILNIENVHLLGDFNLTLIGDGLANQLESDLGDDTLSGGGGDTLISGVGNDSLSGELGNDLLQGGDDDDTLDGGYSSDTLEGGNGGDYLIGGYGDDSIDGGAGVDTADYRGFGGNITVNLNFTSGQNTGVAGIDTLTGIENLIGGTYADRFTGRTDDNIFWGGGSSDTLFGLGGNDTLDGQNGNDKIQGGAGADFLIGGDGWDVILRGTENDSLDGGADNDQLRGGDGADTLNGGIGRDILIGGDYVGGGFPGDGASDVFVYNDVTESQRGGSGREIIRDFEDGIDVIDLSGIDAVAGTAADDAFTFVGSARFTGTAGELRAINTANGTLVPADVDGDGVSDFEIFLNGVITMDSSDFVL